MARTARRDAGAGSIYQRADGYWCASVTLPERDGKRRRKVVASRRKSEVIDKLRGLRRELDRAGDLPTSSPTLAKWLDTWLESIAAPRLKPRTLATYRGYITKHIVPEIGSRRLDRLTPAHVRQVHERIVFAGGSSTTALQAHRILAKALKDAEREGKVTRNVATLLDAPRKAVASRGALTAEQARTLLLSSADDPLEAVHWSLALLAGLRQGERLGLTREAIDLERGVITVSWQLQRLTWSHGCGDKTGDRWPCGYARAGSCPGRDVHIPSGQEAVRAHGGLWLTRPKSRAGWRQVPMAPALAEIMKRHLEQTADGDEGLVLVDDYGHPRDPSRDSAAWHKALAKAGLPSVPLHSARHTTATLLFELGVDERTRVAILGHSSATVTAGYTHVTDVIAHDAMSRLGALVAPQIEP